MISPKLEVVIRMILFLWLQRETIALLPLPPSQISSANQEKVSLLRELMTYLKNYQLIDK
jgi:hypothetical protein